MKCQLCGKEESLPFVCNYCGGVFCADHRLPEAHNCTGDLSRRHVAETTASPFSWSSEPGYKPAAKPRTFSRKELRDIVIAWLALGLAFLVAESSFISTQRLGIVVPNPTDPSIGFLLNPGLSFLTSLIAVGLGFVLHELMHKFSAERYGYEAEFRMWPMGLVLALITSLAGFIFAAPGATYIMGSGISRRENGIISVAGPLTNIAIAALFLPLLLVGGGASQVVGVTGAAVLEGIGSIGLSVNLFLATFNMIPVMPLDGAKVFAWNKAYWGVVFLPLVVILLGLYTGTI